MGPRHRKSPRSGNTGPRWSDAAANYLRKVKRTEKSRSAEGAERAMRRIEAIWGDRPLTGLRTHHLEELQDALRDEGLSATSVNGYVKYALAALRRAVTTDLWEGPVPCVDNLKEDRVEKQALSPDDVARLLRLTPAEPMRTVLRVLLYGGLRISEVIHLDWADLDLVRGKIHVRAKACTCCGGTRWTPKSGQRRTLDISLAADLVEALRVHREREEQRRGRRVRDEDVVFPPVGYQARRTRWAQNKLSIKVSTAFKVAGVKGTAHTLRRTHATLSKAAGVDLDSIRRNLGHSSLAITQGYFANDEEQRRRAVAGIFDQVQRASERARQNTPPTE